MGHGLEQFLPLGRIIDLSEFLRQIQAIPADDAIAVGRYVPLLGEPH